MGRTRSSGDPRVAATRLRNLVETGLFSAAVCFAPTMLAEAGLAPATAWRCASGLFAVSWAGMSVIANVRFGRLVTLKLYERDRIARAFFVLAYAAIATLAINALGVFGALAPTVYVTCLASPFAVSVMLFLRLLSSQFPAANE